MRIFYSIITLLLILTFGCHRQEHDPRLLRVADLAEHSCKEALAALDSIDPDDLSTGDRHFYDLLTIKTNDKNYITHTSDSLILDVISYYENHKDDPCYPEVLYYGGRVFSDLGDYPTSLKYFHRALEELEDDNKNLTLKGHALSQTGRLLNKMRMYREAALCLEEGIRVDSILRKEVDLMYDTQLLGIILQFDKNFPEDRKWLQKSRKIACRLNMPDSAVADLFIARSYHQGKQLDSAYLRIAGIPDLVPSDFRNNAYSIAADIFMDLNMSDSAKKYAHLLINSIDPLNKLEGYEVILTPEMMDGIGTDTLRVYLKEYRRLLDRIMNGHQPQLEAEQQAHYNYTIHSRNAEKAFARSLGLQTAIIIIIFGVIVGGIVVLLIQRKRKNDYQRLLNRLADLEHLQQLTLSDNKLNLITVNEKAYNNKENTFDREWSREELISEIRSRIEEMGKAGVKYEVPTAILKSESYAIIQDHISKEKILPEDSVHWNKLEQTVLQVSPYFKYHLHLLSTKTVRTSFYHIALLIKCGIPSRGICVIIGRQKGTVSNTRSNMAKLILGKQENTQSMDNIIRML